MDNMPRNVKAIILFCVAILCATFVGIISFRAIRSKHEDQLILKDFNQPNKVMISSKIWLCRTSRDVITINDKDGIGLIYGRVLKLGYELNNKDMLLVLYEPFGDENMGDEKIGHPNKLARIEVKSGIVSNIPLEINIIHSLKSADAFFQ